MLARVSAGICIAVVVGSAVADDKEARKDDKPVELNVGDKAPAFDLRTDRDTTWTSADHFGKK